MDVLVCLRDIQLPHIRIAQRYPLVKVVRLLQCLPIYECVMAEHDHPGQTRQDEHQKQEPEGDFGRNDHDLPSETWATASAVPIRSVADHGSCV